MIILINCLVAKTTELPITEDPKEHNKIPQTQILFMDTHYHTRFFITKREVKLACDRHFPLISSHDYAFITISPSIELA